MISVIVHNWCRSYLLPIILRSWSRQEVPQSQVEMVIIDDGSPLEDHFEEYLTLALKTVNINPWFEIRAFKNRVSTMNCGKSMNIGVKQSRGELLVLTHTDIMPLKTDTLVTIEKEHQRTDWMYLIGRTLDTSTPEMVMQSGGIIPWGSSLPRKLFEKLGGFDERFEGYGHEDTDFAWRIIYGAKQMGWIHRFNPEVVFIHLAQARIPGKINPRNEEVLLSNYPKGRWVVNPDGWGISNTLEEVKIE